jgi:hypothetical protein
MSGEGRRGDEPCARLGTLTTAAAGVLGTSLGVLGWLLTQAATFGVAEHVHLTADGLTSHRHDYAAPLALGAAGAALAAGLVLVAVLLGDGRTCAGRHLPDGSGDRGTLGRRPLSVLRRTAPAVAALLFVVVETVELLGSGTPALTMTVVLASGAVLQLLAVPAAAAVAATLVRTAVDLTRLPPTRRRTPVRSPDQPSAFLVELTSISRGPTWDGRAPPGRAPTLVPIP